VRIGIRGGSESRRLSGIQGARHAGSATISDEMTELETRITTNPHQCGGRPCVLGMRIRVCDVLDLLASGLTVDQVLEELPDLEREDILACLRFASHRVNHAILVA